MLTRYPAQIVFLCVLTLCALGFVMLSSAVTGTMGVSEGAGLSPIVKSQAIWLGLGLTVFIVAAFTPGDWSLRLALPLLLITIVLLSLCYVEGVGRMIKGARRWIEIGGLTFQPSELAKPALILFLAWWYQKFLPKTRTLTIGFLLPGAVCSAVVALVLFQKDVGTAALLLAIVVVVMFVAGVRKRYLALLGLVALLSVCFIVINDPVRSRRLTSHLEGQDPRAALGAGYQQRQSIIALGSGGVDGLGLERSLQKMYYLPEAHTDFIFAIIGEELGLRFTLLVVVCFTCLAICGGIIATQARSNAHALIASGVVASLCVQAFINIGVVSSMLPNKGLPLPFISYGGSSLVVALGMTGLLISVTLARPLRRRAEMNSSIQQENVSPSAV